MSPFSNRYIQVATLLLLGLIWGSAFILMKKALRSWSPDEMAAGRILLAGIFLVPFILHQFKLVKKADLLPLLLSGFFGNAIPAFLFAFAQGKIDSAMAGMINSTTPIFTMLFGLLFFRIRASVMSMNGVFLGLAGAVYLIYSYSSSVQGDWRYALLAVAGSACYGVSLNIIKSKLGHLPSLLITGFPFAVTSLMALVYLTAGGTFGKLAQSPEMISDSVYMVTLALFATALGVFLFNMLIKQTTALFASMTTYLIPGFSLLWGFADGEQIGVFYFVGIGIILTAIWLVHRGQLGRPIVGK